MSERLRHLWLSPPFLWPALGTVEVIPGLSVHWLHVVPISDPEYERLLDIGYDRFANEFDEKDVPYYDINRASAV